jgi:hypothetical protein
MVAMTRPLRAPVALICAVALLLAGCGDSGGDGKSGADAAGTTAKSSGGPELGPAFGSMTSLPGVLNTPPPWGRNEAKLQLRLRAIGLDPLTAEGQAVHIHQHLDIYVDGKPVTVPGDVGIGPQNTFISDLHTHASYPPGIIHVESPTVTQFSLGQFFAVWGVPLSATCIGSLCAKGTKQLKAFVNGKAVNADPTRIVLADHQQIVLAYGTAAQVPSPVPSTYAWPEGL